MDVEPPNHSKLTRRDFLRMAGLCTAGLAFRNAPLPGVERTGSPLLNLYLLPERIRSILLQTPDARISPEGYLHLWQDGKPTGQFPMATTQWNREHNHSYDRLDDAMPWAIVLHWYGDRDNFDQTIEGYLRGFDSLRPVDDYITRTSAHFLVGRGPAAAAPPGTGSEIGILQTQAPDKNGRPYLASHLQPLDYLGHQEKKQYFVRALYQLENQGRGVHSVLQDLFDGPQGDPNLRTIAVEICGHGFDDPDSTLTDRQVANVLTVVWALMRRYSIPLSNLLGHHEIQLGKPDPGKKFMTLIRLLVAVKALVENDPRMNCLVFGAFQSSGGDLLTSARRSLDFIRDYLVLVGTQQDVYQWEAASKFWLLMNHIDPAARLLSPVRLPLAPLPGLSSITGGSFLSPENHAGVDIYPQLARKSSNWPSVAAVLPAGGECLYAGQDGSAHPGNSLVFRHILPDGAQILTIFCCLGDLEGIRVGNLYPAGTRLGPVNPLHPNASPFLHLAVAYGATWDTDLARDPHMPLNAGPRWIRSRYLDPSGFLATG